jgi:hypothetical protein
MKTAFPRCHYMRAALFIFLLLTGSPAFSGSDEPQFTRLSDALSFLDQALDQKDWEKLDSALYPPFGSEQPNRNNWPQLERARGDRALKTMFLEMSFSEDRSKFSIGYCGSGPLLHTHIDFVKVGDSWRLTAVWMCR